MGFHDREGLVQAALNAESNSSAEAIDLATFIQLVPPYDGLRDSVGTLMRHLEQGKLSGHRGEIEQKAKEIQTALHAQLDAARQSLDKKNAPPRIQALIEQEDGRVLDMLNHVNTIITMVEEEPVVETTPSGSPTPKRGPSHAGIYTDALSPNDRKHVERGH